MRAAIGWCGSCYMNWTTAYRQTVRPRKEAVTLIGTRSFTILRRVADNGAAQPVISVDGKKKELVGKFKNTGREWRPRGKPEEVRVHDFIDPAQGRAIPYGVYDLTNNAGWVAWGWTTTRRHLR